MNPALQLHLFNDGALPEAQALHSGGVGFLTLMVFNKGEKPKSDPFKVTQLPEVIKYLDPKRDSYLSQCQFFKPNRRVTNLWKIPLCYADLDTYRSQHAGLPVDVLVRELQAFIAGEGLPRPSVVIHSGRGLYVKWFLASPLPQSALPRWGRVQRELTSKLEAFGADAKARDASRILRLVQTVNTKQENPDLKRVRVVDIEEEVDGEPRRYDFEVIADAVLPFTREELVAKREDRAAKWEHEKGRRRLSLASYNPTPYLYRGLKPQQLHWDRFMDMKRLIEIRGGFIAEGLREEMLFLMANSSLWAGTILPSSMFHELKAMGALINPNFKQGSDWTQGDFSTLYRKALDGSAYKFKNQTIMERLQITGDEERQLKTIVSRDEKWRRKREKRGAEERRAERERRVRELRGKGLTIPAIANETGLGQATVKRYLSKSAQKRSTYW